jgi:hypothetical protein
MPQDPEDYQALMEEPPGGYNYGRRDGEELSVEAAQAAELAQVGGFGVIHEQAGKGSTGMVAHRGVNPPTAYVDPAKLKVLVEEGLGFTLDQIGAAYGRGKPTAERLELRARIDARFLALQRKGGNMAALAKVLGMPVREDGECRVMAAALNRARAAEVAA